MTQRPGKGEGESQEGPLGKNIWAEQTACAKALRQELFKKLE